MAMGQFRATVLLCVCFLHQSAAHRGTVKTVNREATVTKVDHVTQAARFTSSNLPMPWQSFLQTFESQPPTEIPESVKKCGTEMQAVYEKELKDDLEKVFPHAQSAKEDVNNIEVFEDMWSKQKQLCENHKDMSICQIEAKIGTAVSAKLEGLCVKQSCIESKQWFMETMKTNPQIQNNPPLKLFEMEVTCSAHKMGLSLLALVIALSMA